MERKTSNICWSLISDYSDITEVSLIPEVELLATPTEDNVFEFA